MHVRAFKIEIAPNKTQEKLLKQSVGVARFAYNWALSVLKEDYDSGTKKYNPNSATMSKILNSIKKQEFPWMYDVSKCCALDGLRRLEKSFQNFFDKKASFPKFKRKNSGKDSFYATGSISIKDGRISIPRIGKLKLKQKDYAPDGNYGKVTVSKRANHWFISVQAEVENASVNFAPGTSIGIDLGIKTLAVTSDGERFETPKKEKKLQRRMKRLQRKLSRQKKGSNNRLKTKAKISKLHYRISCHRSDAIHKMTSYLVKTKPVEMIVIEDLNVEGMKRNHCLAGAVSNSSFGEIRRQLEYKTRWTTGKQLFVIDRFFPSSKRCHCCGAINEQLKLKDRFWTCQNCGAVHDRDENAAININEYPELPGNLSSPRTKKTKAASVAEGFVETRIEEMVG